MMEQLIEFDCDWKGLQHISVIRKFLSLVGSDNPGEANIMAGKGMKCEDPPKHEMEMNGFLETNANTQDLENGSCERETDNVEDNQRFRHFCISDVRKRRVLIVRIFIAIFILGFIASVICNIIKCGCGSGKPEEKNPSFSLSYDNQILTQNTTGQLKQLQTTALPSIMKCPPNWLPNEKMCYFFSDIQMSWDYSQRNCSSYGGFLLIIHSQQEWAFVKEHRRPAEYWINLCRKTEEDTWKWPNGTSVDNWLYIGGSGLCGYLNEKAASSTYCYNDRYWICSKPISSI